MKLVNRFLAAASALFFMGCSSGPDNAEDVVDKAVQPESVFPCEAVTDFFTKEVLEKWDGKSEKELVENSYPMKLPDGAYLGTIFIRDSIQFSRERGNGGEYCADYRVFVPSHDENTPGAESKDRRACVRMSEGKCKIIANGP